MGKSLALTKRIVSFFMLTAVVAVGIISVRAQSQAINGQIEGLRGISLDPFRLLVAPRVVGSAIAITAPYAAARSGGMKPLASR